MKQILALLAMLIFFNACNVPETPTATATVTFPLKEYVMEGDDAFSYEVVESVKGETWTEYRIRMISGTWLTELDVDETEWWHWVNIIIPDKVKETESMMIIGGGSKHDTIPIETKSWMVEAAIATGSIISYVSNIPFQPLNYKNDQKDDRFEDDLIAYGWRQYLESGASDDKLEWLARFPMTRAVVRAMDVVQEIGVNNNTPVEGFFVTGASKRGWTTWTTAAVDERVIGIAPIVIDLLNIIPSFHHHWQCYGEWAPAIQDYVDEGIMDWIDSEEFKAMLEIVGPYSFIDQLNMPKLLINATSDEFFVTDSWKFYWNDLRGDSYLRYVPNGNHGLRGTPAQANLFSFYQTTITETEIPEFNWNISNDTIYMQVDPESDYIIRKWEAINEADRDFRIYVVGEVWQREELDKQPDGSYAIHFSSPESGYKAALVEIIFNPVSDYPLTFTSGTLVTPDTYPFAPFEPAEPN